jgi:uncharacterized protein YcfJ
MNTLFKTIFAVGTIALAAQATAQVTLYENDDFRGRAFTTRAQVTNFSRFGFNDRASSVQVFSGRWEVCEDSNFSGRCVVLRAGRYPNLSAMSLNDRVSSVREVRRNTRINDQRYAPMPIAVGPDFRRRNGERLYQAPVTSVRAVVGAPEQRCWIEREQVAQEQPRSNVPGAVIGAVLGGVLGHQIGGGAGKDLATVGGAVAGAAIGAQTGRNNDPQATQNRDVQRCREVPSQAPVFWDVSYNFRGQDHRVQLTAAPGRSVTVNGRGEPRE